MPPVAHIIQAQEVLANLGAIEKGKITDTGKRMLRLPTHPRLAHLLLEGAARGWHRLAAQTAAVLEERDLLAQNRHTADLSERIEALNNNRGDPVVRERIKRLAAEWERALARLPGLPAPHPSTSIDPYAVGLLVAAAYPERIARQRQGTCYRLANGRNARLPDQDPLDREPWLAVASLDGAVGEGKIFLAAPLDPKALGHLAKPQDNLSWDIKAGRLVAARELKIGPLMLSSQPLAQVSEEAKAVVICAAVKQEGLRMLGWGEAEQKWQLRVLTLKIWHPEEGWPDVSDSALLACLEEWLAPYLGPVRKAEDFDKLNLLSLASSLLRWHLSQELDARAPRTITVPTGSAIAVEYRPDGDLPILAVRLQELFGQADTPTVDNGRKPVLLHLLSPGYKPVQVTQSLASFWANTYADVRKDLRGRYPKHSWPDNPLEAEPIRGAKKRGT
jgi:ATP-dependent helicase HrpB